MHFVLLIQERKEFKTQNSVIGRGPATALQGFRSVEAQDLGAERSYKNPLWVKAEGQHLLYPGRFPESKSKPGLGREPFIVISVFVQPVARSDKALFSRSKCSDQKPRAGAAERGLSAGRLLETPISLRQRRKKERATLPAFGLHPSQLLHTAFLCHLVTDKHQAY